MKVRCGLVLFGAVFNGATPPASLSTRPLLHNRGCSPNRAMCHARSRGRGGNFAPVVSLYILSTTLAVPHVAAAHSASVWVAAALHPVAVSSTSHSRARD